MGRRYKRQRYHPRRLPSIDRLCSPKRMDIYFARLPLHIGSYIIGGERPVIVVSNDIANETAGMVTVIPMTSQAKRMEMPTHILVDEERPSVAMVEHRRLPRDGGRDHDRAGETLFAGAVERKREVKQQMEKKSRNEDGRR